MRNLRITISAAFVCMLVMSGCSGLESDLPAPVEWRFDEPQPGWKVTIPRPFPAEIRPATVSQTDVALKIALGPSTANPSGRLVGGAFIEVPEWDHRDWAYVKIQARSSGPCNIRLGFNVWNREGHPNEGRPNPYEMWGGGPLAPLAGDGTVRTIQLPLEPRDSWERPIRQLGLWIGAADPLEVEILSITVVPMDAAIGEGGIAETQEKPDDDAIWEAFIGWFRSAPKEAEALNATPEVQAALKKQLEHHYFEEWPSTKLPALGSKTPLQAVKMEEGRVKVTSLIDDLDVMQDRSSSNMPRLDFDRLRRKLDLPPKAN